MSKKSSELGISRSTVLFILLMLALGALLLASNTLDPRSLKRAEPFTPTPTVVDPYANLDYIPFKSPEGAYEFDYPKGWFVQPDSNGTPVTYIIVPSGLGPDGISITAMATVNSGISNAQPDTPPDQLAKLLAASAPTTQQTKIDSVQGGGLKGASLHVAVTATNQTTGEQIPVEKEIWFLSLDSTHILVFQMSAATTDWPQMQGVFDHLSKTLKVDTATVLKLIEQQATPAPTAAATAGF